MSHPNSSNKKKVKTMKAKTKLEQIFERKILIEPVINKITNKLELHSIPNLVEYELNNKQKHMFLIPKFAFVYCPEKNKFVNKRIKKLANNITKEQIQFRNLLLNRINELSKTEIDNIKITTEQINTSKKMCKYYSSKIEKYKQEFENYENKSVRLKSFEK